MRLFTGLASSQNCKLSLEAFDHGKKRLLINIRCYSELRLELDIAKPRAPALSYPDFYPTPPLELGSQNESGWYFYLAEVALRRFGNRILAHVYQYDPNTCPKLKALEEVVNFERQAEDWSVIFLI